MQAPPSSSVPSPQPLPEPLITSLSGLVPSAAEEERALADPSEAYAPADAAAAAATRADARAGLDALAAALSHPKQRSGMPGVLRIAASAPLRQLQLLRSAWTWVLRNARAPPPPAHPESPLLHGRECVDGMGAAGRCGGKDMGLWRVRPGLFGAADDPEAAELEEVRIAVG